MTVAFIDAHRDRFAVAAMCRVLEFSERSFYAAKTRPACARAVADVDRKTLISVEWKANYSCCTNAPEPIRNRLDLMLAIDAHLSPNQVLSNEWFIFDSLQIERAGSSRYQPPLEKHPNCASNR